MSSIPIPWNRIHELAKLLRATRENLGLTQQQVADAIDIPAGVYGRIERAGMMPSTTTLKKACLRLGLDYQSVVTRMAPENDSTMD
jgi:transcriptional regulator with XRE-family HTH domain